MKTKWMVALSALSVAAILGAAIGVMATVGMADNATQNVVDDTNDVSTTDTNSTHPLLTFEQMQNLRELERELRDIGLDRNLTSALVDQQVEEYVAENLKSYGLTDMQVAQVMDVFDAIDNKTAEIRDFAYQMREQGATLDEIVAAIEPMISDLQDLQDQLASKLEGYNISTILPTNPPERPEGPRPPNGDPNAPVLRFSC